MNSFIYRPYDVNIIDEKGKCPLMYAIENNNIDFVRYLLNLKAETNLKCIGKYLN